MRLRRELDLDRVARPDLAALYDDAHHPRLADQLAVGIAVEDRLHQPRRDLVELGAWVAQPLEVDDRLASQAQARTRREGEQLYAARGHVFAHLAGRDLEA